MREISKKSMEKLLVGGIGLFVGQVPIYAIHSLAVAFFVAAYLNNLESAVLFLTILGSVYMKLSFFGVLKYGIILVLAWLFGKPFQKERLGVAMSIYIGLLVFLVNVVFGCWLGAGPYVLTLPEACLEAVIAGVGSYLLKDGIQWKTLLSGKCSSQTSSMISTGILLAIVLYGMPKAGIFASIVLGIGAFVVLYFSFCYGMGEGAFFGTVCGMVLMYQTGGTNIWGAIKTNRPDPFDSC